MKIGFIGLGRMGYSLACSLLRNKQPVVAFDINKEVTQKIQSQGAVVAGTIAELCQKVDVVLTMLPGPKEVMQVATMKGGIVDSLSAGSIFLDLSTVDVKTVDKLSALSSEKGIVFGDAPVGRLAAHADRGESLFMLGIEQKMRSTVESLLYKMGTTVIYCGGAGAGVRTKLINNLMVLSYCQINSEALVLAKALGLDIERLFQVLTSTTAVNGQLKEKWPEKVLAGDLTPGFNLSLGLKDLTLACQSAKDKNITLAVGEVAKEFMTQAAENGYADKDTSSLTDFYAIKNGIDLIRL